jgi:hypothetical protein
LVPFYTPIRSGFNITAATLPETGGSGSTNDIKADYAVELSVAHDAPALLNRLDLLLTAGQLKPVTKSRILEALGTPALTIASSDADKRNRVAAAIFLIMASADYLVQK